MTNIRYGSDHAKIYLWNLTVCYNIMISVKILPRRAILYQIGARNGPKGLEMEIQDQRPAHVRELILVSDPEILDFWF